MRTLLCLLVACLLGSDFFAHSTLRAAESKEAAPNDPDFAVQGEYVGEFTPTDQPIKYGVQVISLGKGKFRMVARKKGLPGDGWNEKEEKPLDFEPVDGVFTYQEFDGTFTIAIKDGVIVVKKDDKVVGTLKRIVRKSPTFGAKPPKGAVVLFDGKSAEQFEGGRMTDDGLLKQGATSKFKHQSGTLHLEFQIPYGPLLPSRGNSGVYLQSRYEVQMLDSFGVKPHNHECGGIRRSRSWTSTCPSHRCRGKPTTSTSRPLNSPTARRRRTLA